jgi:hypothetical protein
MKTLFLALGSYKVPDTTGFDADNFDRQLLYTIALTNLCGMVNKDTEIVVVENTVGSISELHPPLQQALRLPQITDVLFSRDNLGANNKGAGEYGLCKYASQKRADLFAQAEWVVYYTHRHTMPFGLMFDYLEKYGSFDALVARAPYFFLDGSMSPAEPGQFDDVIFAMKKDVFLKYVDNMDPAKLTKAKMSSEENLYRFLTQGKYNFKQVERFGVCRYNYFNYQTEII